MLWARRGPEDGSCVREDYGAGRRTPAGHPHVRHGELCTRATMIASGHRRCVHVGTGSHRRGQSANKPFATASTHALDSSRRSGRAGQIVYVIPPTAAESRGLDTTIWAADRTPPHEIVPARGFARGGANHRRARRRKGGHPPALSSLGIAGRELQVRVVPASRRTIAASCRKCRGALTGPFAAFARG